jgi:hypothetical protein
MDALGFYWLVWNQNQIVAGHRLARPAGGHAVY